MAATTKLIVWNAVLREIGSAPLANTTDVNTRQYELNAAWDHAVEHMLSMRDWGFARRRGTLTGVSDSSYPPYTYRYTKPTDYLRKCWVKLAANDEYQADHAEVASVFYGMEPTALIEYMSDHADNYDPANWPPHFTRVLTLYLASLVSPKLARAGAGDVGMLDGKMSSALADAEQFETLFLTNIAIPSARQPVFRRALEFMGQALSGSVAVHSHGDMLRWHMNQSWSHAVKYILEMAAWNFATRRAILTVDSVPVPGSTTGYIEGYSLGPAVDVVSADDSLPDIAGFDYGFTLPEGFLHKIWLKPDANSAYECRHQFMGASSVYTSESPVVLEYVAYDTDSTNPENWSANVLEAVAAYLALLVTPEIVAMVGAKGAIKIDANGIKNKIEQVYMAKLSDAKLRDAIQQYPLTPPLGRFARARLGGTGTSSLRRFN